MKRFARRASTRRISYRVVKGSCLGCQFREQCTPMGQDRTISRFFDQKLVEEAKKRLSSSTGEELLKQRKVRAEGVFALAKELHGLRRTRFMGRWKIQIQLWLTAAVINIKRAIKQLARIEPIVRTIRRTDKTAAIGRLAYTTKEIIGLLHYLLFGLPNHFGNSPYIFVISTPRTVQER